ncbi:MAG: hypothetical protein QF645_06525 [Planctomycetota bacterium]|nr:hypothetical protein [Planctomycetota bacterium]
MTQITILVGFLSGTISPNMFPGDPPPPEKIHVKCGHPVSYDPLKFLGEKINEEYEPRPYNVLEFDGGLFFDDPLTTPSASNGYHILFETKPDQEYTCKCGERIHIGHHLDYSVPDDKNPGETSTQTIHGGTSGEMGSESEVHYSVTFKSKDQVSARILNVGGGGPRLVDLTTKVKVDVEPVPCNTRCKCIVEQKVNVSSRD